METGVVEVVPLSVFVTNETLPQPDRTPLTTPRRGSFRQTMDSFGSGLGRYMSGTITQVSSEIGRLTKEISDLTINLEENLKGSIVHTERLAVFVKLINFFSMCGVLLMILENELLFANGNNPTEHTDIVKVFISLSTIITVYFVYAYYRTRQEVVRLRGSRLIEDASLPSKYIQDAVLEIIIQLVHPIPFVNYHVDIEMRALGPIRYNVDNILGAIMLFRVYLLYRTIKFTIGFHLRSIELFGKLNNVQTSSSFALKASLHLYPFYFLPLSILFNIMFSAYGVRLCEHNNHDVAQQNFAESVWMIYVSITTIGYGDVTVQTYCARTFVFIGWLWGAINSALLISVVKRNLVLTRPQAFVTTFLKKSEATKFLNHNAAAVIQSVWRAYKNPNLSRESQIKVQSQILSWSAFRKKLARKEKEIERIANVNADVKTSLERVRRIRQVMKKTEEEVDKLYEMAMLKQEDSSAFALASQECELAPLLQPRSRTSRFINRCDHLLNYFNK